METKSTCLSRYPSIVNQFMREIPPEGVCSYPICGSVDANIHTGNK